MDARFPGQRPWSGVLNLQLNPNRSRFRYLLPIPDQNEWRPVVRMRKGRFRIRLE